MNTLLPINNFYKKILRIALPAIAGLSTQMVVSLVDTAMVGRLSEATYALAAMGIGVLATWALISFFSSLATGTHVIVARRFGQKDYVECGNTLNNSLFISLTIGIIVAAIGAFFAKPIADLFASDDEVAFYASEYIFYRFLGIPFFLISVSYRGFYFGISKTKIFMISGIITNLLNIVFNYIFIFGNLGMSRMGLAGAGLGSTLASSFDFFFYTAIMLLPSYRNRFQNFRRIKIDFDVIRSIWKISIPVSLQNVFILIGFLIFVAITGIIGTQEQAATQATISTLFISFLPCFGFGIAVQTLVGNNLGAGKLNLAKIYGFETAKVATIYTLILGIIFILFPQYVLLMITNDTSIIQTAKPVLRIAGFAQIFYAVGVVLANALQAAGKMLFVMKAEVITNLFVLVPLSYLFGVVFGYGLTGAWFAMPIYIILYSAIIFSKFLSKDWYEKIPLKSQ
ncbi:MATE family multidrug resistance protein [Ignavibacterium album JCM 16511]|uniref:Multidrug-efflux transporter n=1 Tax=Ignavibacterium album (strain DSM 19864 / JCM 16511 / NBRC 101810 / Mat9-16) TaxID=945713 RepID=I0AK88_IGNAJ|nr:MATE family efflux transporter [Ignavibacterium album]AFH49395.1 MATE family multidrug resistance protein [Ignavibacterium album JCM 16511]